MAKHVDIRLVDTFGARVPVRGGVPFPQGDLKPSDRVRLLGLDGAAVPFDAEPIGLWPDGTVRWLRLDLVAPQNQPKLVLNYGAGAGQPPQGQLRIIEDNDAYTVDTGVLRFGIGRRRFELMSNCAIASGRGVSGIIANSGIELATTDYFRRRHLASDDANCSCELEESGQTHAVFLIRGVHDDKRGKLFDYRLRLHCYAGSPAVRLTYTLMSRQNEELPLARAVEVTIPLPFDASTFATGIETGYTLEDDVSENGVELVQTGPARMRPDERFQYCQGSTMVGRKGEGWIAAVGPKLGVTAAVRRFWQKHAKGFRVSGNELAVELWPQSIEQPMVLPQGCEKTFDLMLIFHGARENDLAEAALIARAFTKPAAITCLPGWYCGSGAMGRITPAGTRGFEEFGRAAAAAFAALKKRRAEFHEYGDIDYGDFVDTGEPDGWINVEYDTPHCLLTQFARTAKRDYLDWGIDAAAHQGDVDTAHYVPADQNLVGSQSIHGTGHLARESKWFYYRTDHIWAEGLVDAYWLTGDRQHLGNALLVGDYLARVEPCPDETGEERPYGWSLIGLMAVYQATLDAKYLTAAARIAKSILDRSHPERGLWLREFTDADGNPVHGSIPFMSGILVDGMIAYNAAARDPRVDDFIVKAARTWVREAWVEKDGGFYYHPGAPDRGRPMDFRQLPGLIYAYELTRDRTLLKTALRNFEAGILAYLGDLSRGKPFSAKGYAIFLRSAPRFVAALKRLRIRSAERRQPTG